MRRGPRQETPQLKMCTDNAHHIRPADYFQTTENKDLSPFSYKIGDFMFQVPAPNHTQTPNVLFDEWLPKLKLVELRVLMVIFRKTFGWHKIRDRISLTQLELLTGSQRSDIIKAGKTLEKMGLITREVVGKNGDSNTFYELVVHEDSNKNYQCESHTPPSVNFTPTKETLTKETISPIVPKGDIPSRKQKIEEKIQRESHVWTSPRQHADLEIRCSKKSITVESCYDKLNTWKIAKEIFGGKNDYKAIVDWVIDSVVKNDSSLKTLQKEKDLAKKVIEKFPIQVTKNEIQLQEKGLLFCYGRIYEFIEFTQFGFRDKVFSRLRKMNLSIEEL